ncbi:RNA-directed DNA polymerase, eukaryota [Tanacetum coccineum]|uniref:RNA-directed DNA polymerase, eukaryota n=1 Tax=Tanacetum coccineum TaxID=301880 RepID=A0ABQ4ZA31_9ASTR
MERLRRDFFYGVKDGDRKIAWIKWTKVLASKKFGGLGVSSLFALNRALIFKWVWRFLSHDNSLWSRVIAAVHGSSSHPISAAYNSPWGTIIKEVKALNDKGINLVSHCKIRVGNGLRTSFWNDLWIGDNQLKLSFPRLFALEVNKDCSVADKLNAPFTASFRRQTRGGPEAQQLEQLTNLLDSVSLSNMEDRCFWDLNGEGVFQVKDVRSVLDETFLPKENIPTRWVKSIPIKVNVFVWKLVQDRIPTRLNLMSRNIFVPSVECPVCNNDSESSSHLFFGCQVAKEVLKLICRWWDLVLYDFDNYDGWLLWFKSIRLGSKLKGVLEGSVFLLSLQTQCTLDMLPSIILNFFLPAVISGWWLKQVLIYSVVSDAKVSKPTLLLDDSCLNVSEYSLSLIASNANNGMMGGFSFIADVANITENVFQSFNSVIAKASCATNHDMSANTVTLMLGARTWWCRIVTRSFRLSKDICHLRDSYELVVDMLVGPLVWLEFDSMAQVESVKLQRRRKRDIFGVRKMFSRFIPDGKMCLDRPESFTNVLIESFRDSIVIELIRIIGKTEFAYWLPILNTMESIPSLIHWKGRLQDGPYRGYSRGGCSWVEIDLWTLLKKARFVMIRTCIMKVVLRMQGTEFGEDAGEILGVSFSG